MRYSIRLFTNNAQYTAYDGTSYRAAQNAVEILRSVLIMTGGTAGIFVSYDGARNIPLWHVTDGAAQPTDNVLEPLCVMCGEPFASHRTATDNSAAFCMSPASRPGDRFIRGKA